MKIIKVDTDLNVSVHDFPTGNYSTQNEYLQKLIGNECEIYERVMPRRLYSLVGMKRHLTDIQGQCVSVLVDEEGRLKGSQINTIGSFLYETDRHGQPIVGNILFVGERRAHGSIEFCGISDDAFEKLYQWIKAVANVMKGET